MATASSIQKCPSCGTKNRVPASASGKPACAACKAPLPWLTEATDSTFDAVVLRATTPVLVDLWAPWCGPCRMMAPQFEAAAMQLEPALRLAKVDTEAQPALGSRFGIRSIPTLVLFKAGREIGRMSGAMASGEIVRWARAQLVHP